MRQHILGPGTSICFNIIIRRIHEQPNISQHGCLTHRGDQTMHNHQLYTTNDDSPQDSQDPETPTRNRRFLIWDEKPPPGHKVQKSSGPAVCVVRQVSKSCPNIQIATSTIIFVDVDSDLQARALQMCNSAGNRPDFVRIVR